VLVRCPSCRNTFATGRTGVQDCPLCGKPLAVPEPASVVSPTGTATSEASAVPFDTRTGTPWERRQETGAWRAWRDTLVESLFEPAKLFGAARTDRGWAQAGFAVATISTFSIVGQMLNRFLLGPWRQRAMESLRAQRLVSPIVEKLFAAGTGHSGRVAIAVVLLTPPIVFVFLYVNAAVTHACATLLGQNKRGFSATFAACAYGCAPLVLLAIPGCGESIAIVWAAILTGIGLKHMHGIGSGGATATVLAPYLLMCCGVCALAGLFAAERGGLGQ